MNLIDFVRKQKFVVGWTDENSYAQMVNDTVIINLHLFLATTAIHEYIHHTHPDIKLDGNLCSKEVQRKTTKLVKSLSKSVLMEIAEVVNKSLAKNQRKAMEDALHRVQKRWETNQ